MAPSVTNSPGLPHQAEQAEVALNFVVSHYAFNS